MCRMLEHTNIRIKTIRSSAIAYSSRSGKVSDAISALTLTKILFKSFVQKFNETEAEVKWLLIIVSLT